MAPGWELRRAPAQPALGPRDDPGSAQDEPRSTATPARPLDAGALRALACDLLGRSPFAAERPQWLGRARHDLCDAWIGGLEFWENWLEEQLYYFFLIDNFRPENERVLALPRDLAAGKLDAREATHLIALSPSFDQRNPGADTFVTVVMEQFTGVTVQKNVRELEIGKAIYDGASGVFLGKTGRRQADIVEIAVRHKAFAETFIAREYVRLLGFEPQAKERAEWSRRFHQDPGRYPDLVREWMLSEAWDRRLVARRNMPNRLFARVLHVDLLDRLPSAEEARRLRSALDGMSDAAPLRSVFARMLIDSGQLATPEKKAIVDATRWVAELFRRLLGREASEDELREFVTAFHDPECRPQTVLYAIVTHPEYQTY